MNFTKTIINAIKYWVNNKFSGVESQLDNIESQLDEKQPLGNYVSQVEGKGLSTEDYTTEEKEKLAGIDPDSLALDSDLEEVKTLVGDTSVADQIDAALANSQSDWNQNDSTQPDYVKNRPFYTGDPVESALDLTGAIWTLQDVLYMTEYMGEGNFPLTVGGTATLTVDGKKYTGIVEDYSSLMGAGFVGFGDIDGFVNNDVSAINFLVYGGSADGQFVVYVAVKADAEPTSCTIGSIVHEVKQIDSKYLPGVLLPKIAYEGQIMQFNGLEWALAEKPGKWEHILTRSIKNYNSTSVEFALEKNYKRLLVTVANVVVDWLGTESGDLIVSTAGITGTYAKYGIGRLPGAGVKRTATTKGKSFLLMEKYPEGGYISISPKTPYVYNSNACWDLDVKMYRSNNNLYVDDEFPTRTLYICTDTDEKIISGNFSVYGMP